MTPDLHTEIEALKALVKVHRNYERPIVIRDMERMLAVIERLYQLLNTQQINALEKQKT